jgi:site-specific DNA-cytosine methylase
MNHEKEITFGSLFTGIGGFDEGFEKAGMRCLWQIENDKDCNRVLRKQYPNRSRFQNVQDCGKHNLERPDVICGGFPCQDLSVAGLRKGLAGARSGLWREMYRIIAELEPLIVIIENVPGLLSSWSPIEPPPFEIPSRIFDSEEEARRFIESQVCRDWNVEEASDIETILVDLCQLGRCVGVATLDSQYFGVPQRRDRVFIVGSLGSGCCAQILFEPESVRGDSPPSRRTRENIAGPIGGSSQSGGFRTTDLDNNGAFIPMIAGCLQERDSKGSEPGHLIPVVTAPLSASNHHGDQLSRESQLVPVCFKPSHFTRDKDGSPTDIYPPLSADADKGDQEALVFVEQVADPISAHEGKTHTHEGSGNFRARNVIAFSHKAPEATPAEEVSPPLRSMDAADGGRPNGSGQIAIAFTERTRDGKKVVEAQNDLAYSLNNPGNGGRRDEANVAIAYVNPRATRRNKTSHQFGIKPGTTSDALGLDGPGAVALAGRRVAVRRLTPRECERLQALEDDWTRFDGDGEEISDSARYRMLGNAVTETVSKWIGGRLVTVLRAI